jgi:hypothetical protein
LREKENANRELQVLTPPEEKSQVLDRLAEFLKSVAETWREANQDQRNRIARQLFEEIWVKDKQVIAVKPRPELEPFSASHMRTGLGSLNRRIQAPPGSPDESRYLKHPIKTMIPSIFLPILTTLLTCH